jgi:hypothetical protein
VATPHTTQQPAVEADVALARRFLGVAQFAVGQGPQPALPVPSASGRSGARAAAVHRDDLEHDAGAVTRRAGFAALLGRPKSSERQPTWWPASALPGILQAEPGREVEREQTVVAALGGRVRDWRRRSLPGAVTYLDQVGATEQLGGAELMASKSSPSILAMTSKTPSDLRSVMQVQ